MFPLFRSSFLKDYVKKLREKSGLSQSDFADKLGVSTNAICSIENGYTKNPSKKLLESLAEYNEENVNKTYRDIVFSYEANLSKFDLITLYASWYSNYGQVISHYNLGDKNMCDCVLSYKDDNRNNLTLFIDIDKLVKKKKDLTIMDLTNEIINLYNNYYMKDIGLMFTTHNQYRNRKTDIKTVHFVCDYNNKKHQEQFEKLEKIKYQYSILKMEVFVNLFDTKKYKLIKTIKLK